MDSLNNVSRETFEKGGIMKGTGQAIVNQIRANASDQYRAAVAELNAKNIGDVGAQILNFTPVYNEFINVFFNKIVLSIMDQRQFVNPFRALIKGGSPLGGVIQDTHTNPAASMPYDINATSRLLQNYRPDVQVSYYYLNRKDIFAVTRARQELELAFNSYEQLDAFFTQIIDSLYSGNEIREFQLWKALFASAYLSDAMRMIPVATPTNKDSAMNFLGVLQTISLAMTFPGAKYNNYQAMAAKQGQFVSPSITWTPQGKQLIIMDSSLASPIGLYVQASAFNLSYATLQDRIIYVDNLMVTGLLAIICDENAPQVRDSKREFRDFENGATLTLNSFFHVWQYYNIRLWANMVALYDPNAVAPQLSVNDGQPMTIGINAVQEYDYTVTYNEDKTETAYLEFTSTTNNLALAYTPGSGKIKITTSKDSVPGTYTVMVTAQVNDAGKDLFNTTIATITIQ